MGTADINRIKKELRECSKDRVVEAELVSESNLLHWKGRIKGPVGTPYDGGTFIIDINLPNDYPFVPPKMKFDTRIWHPNISSESGAICLDILKNEWSPALTIRTGILQLGAALCRPPSPAPRSCATRLPNTMLALLAAPTAAPHLSERALPPSRSSAPRGGLPMSPPSRDLLTAAGRMWQL